jgi:hypothetical protein
MEQEMPQPPQLAESLRNWAASNSQPSVTSRLQSAQPASQPPRVQVEVTQAGAPLGAEHVLPQAPQFAGSPSRLAASRSQPSEGAPLQSQ